MPAKTKSVVPVEPGVLEARRELARRIASITGGVGEHVTAIPGIVLYHRDEPTPCYRASYEPSLSIFVQGRKHVILGELSTSATRGHSSCPQSTCPQRVKL